MRFCFPMSLSFFFFNDPTPTKIYTLSLHDALPIFQQTRWHDHSQCRSAEVRPHPESGSRGPGVTRRRDRKSTRLNSSHVSISYAVFCLKKKKKHTMTRILKNLSHTRSFEVLTHSRA